MKDPNKKNIIRIEVTEKGYDFHRKAWTHDSIERVVSVLTEKEKKELWSALSKIRGQANQELGIKSADLYPPLDYSILFSEKLPNKK